jgi:hypothetical protein
VKPIPIYRLTPAQIALVERLATSEAGVAMDAMEYREIVAYQELDRLGMAQMRIARRRKITIVLTELGTQARNNSYFSKKPVVRLTQPQIAALRFLAGASRRLRDIPGTMIDVCRRMSLRGWAEYHEDDDGHVRVAVTMDGWNVLKLVDGHSQQLLS